MHDESPHERNNDGTMCSMSCTFIAREIYAQQQNEEIATNTGSRTKSKPLAKRDSSPYVSSAVKLNRTQF
jgi:hypothetical protein